MITRLQLSNWKSFGEGAEIYFDPLTVVTGANDSGKSDLLEALWFLSRLPKARSVDSVFDDEAAARAFRGGADRVIRRGCERLSFVVEADREDRGTVVRYTYSLDLGSV